MIVDTSVVMAVLESEADAAALFDILLRAESCLMSAGSAVELGIVCARRVVPIPESKYGAVLREAEIRIAPVDEEQVRLAWTAFSTYGRGRHPAGLNYGDCFAYALAKQTGRPLLFKGDDFSRTDVSVAAW
jgi:ribonuclease VapC